MTRALFALHQLVAALFDPGKMIERQFIRFGRIYPIYERSFRPLFPN
jgi:hypothetical protein